MTNREGPRAGGPSTIRLEEQSQPLPDRDAIFHTPRAGDWLLLLVLVIALVGIGLRVWAQLGWRDVTGRAVFAGLALVAIYWAAIIYIFKLSLALRVGPQGLAIVRGPWRTELRWSEITRLMERPQNIGGRRYRWVVALARDSRRIQVREDALLDYERFRREVYERYRMWRDHGGTWGATGGGPFVARESVGEEMRWWTILGLLIALPGVYCSFLLPGAQLVGYVLLAVAALCIIRVIVAYLRRRVYSLDGKMIESRGLLQRAQLAWRDIVKVERAQSPAGGAILALVAVGRFTLRLVSRSDSGIRGFAWSPRVPEYMTLRGGGRQVRVRLHHLTHPEELAAWIDFYTGVRKSAASRPLEAVVDAPPRPAASAPSESLTGAGSSTSDGRRTQTDLSGAAGPLDPWGGDRSGELAGEMVAAEFGAPSDLMQEPAASVGQIGHPPMPEPLFRGAPLSSSFREQGGLDQPPDMLDPEAAHNDAWLRETSAHFSMNNPASRPSAASQPASSRPAPGPSQPQPQPPQAPPRGTGVPTRPSLDPAASAGFASDFGDQPPLPQRARTPSRQFVPPPGPRRSTVAPGSTAGAPSAPVPPVPPARPAPRPPSQPGVSSPFAAFAPYSPDLPDGRLVEERPPAAPASAPERAPAAPPTYEAPRPAPATPIAPEPQPRRMPPPQAAPQPQYAAPQYVPTAPESQPDETPDRADRGEIQPGSDDYVNEDATSPELPSAPWQDAEWQPPALPRFGPPTTPTDDGQRGNQ